MMRWSLSCAAGLVMAGMVAEAHHSIAGVYDSARDTTIDGTVSQFHFVQPHPFIVIDVRRGSAAEAWHVELDNRRELADIGFTETTLKPGDRIVVSGSPSRRDARRMYLQRLDRPADGFSYEQAGSRPRLRTPPR